MITLLDKLSHMDIMVVFVGVVVIIYILKEGFGVWDWAKTRFGWTSKKEILEQQYHDKLDGLEIALRSINQHISQLDNRILEVAQKQDDISQLQNECEVNKLRDKLLQSYRYYKCQGSWNEMEAETFWALFEDYTKRGGNSFMRNVVEPEMKELEIEEIASE